MSQRQRQPFARRRWAVSALARLGLMGTVLAVWPAAPALHAQVATAPSAASAAQRPALPGMGDGADLSSGVERQLGDRIAREIYRDPDFIDDAVIADYVQGIWRPLLMAARELGELGSEIDERFVWEIMLGRDRTINAFALPGGYLGVHLGLVAAVNSADELAAVLAHELSHVTQRHISRMIGQQNRQGPLLIGAMILAAIAAAKNPAATGAVLTGSQALAIQNQLNFSRDMEREADRVGYSVLVRAGYAPQGAVQMFQKLAQAARLNDNGNFPYLRTHPLTTERLSDMQSRQQLLPREQTALGTLEHRLVAARAQVLANADIESLRQRVAQAGGSPQALYAASLASLKLRDADAAQRHALALRDAVGGDAQAAQVVRYLLAEIALARNDATAALAALQLDESPAAMREWSRAQLMLWGQAQVMRGTVDSLVDRLQTWVALQPRDGSAWQMLSAAYQRRGDTLRAVRADAESFVARLDYPAALDRLRAAQDMVAQAARDGRPVDHIEASIIDSRTRQVSSMVREQALQR